MLSKNSGIELHQASPWSFETAQADLELAVFLPLPPKFVCVITPSLTVLSLILYPLSLSCPSVTLDGKPEVEHLLSLYALSSFLCCVITRDPENL